VQEISNVEAVVMSKSVFHNRLNNVLYKVLDLNFFSLSFVFKN